MTPTNTTTTIDHRVSLAREKSPAEAASPSRPQGFEQPGSGAPTRQTLRDQASRLREICAQAQTTDQRESA